MAIIILTACDRNLDAFELLELAHEAQEQADVVSMTMEIDAEVSMSDGERSMHIPMTIQFEVESEERMRMDMSMSVMGEEMNTVLFVRGSYGYGELDGHRTRTALDMDNSEITDFIDGMFGDDFIDNFTYIDEDLLETSTAERTDDGGYRLEFIFNIDGLVAFFEDTDLGILGMDNFGDLSDFDEEQENWGMVMIVYLDEDYLFTSATVTAEFGAVEAFTDVRGQEIDMEIEMTMVMLFEDVIIDFPDWLDEELK